jgi:hypothetical protein
MFPTKEIEKSFTEIESEKRFTEIADGQMQTLPITETENSVR